MKRRSLLCMLAFCATLAGAAAAPDVRGKWTAQVDQQQITFDFTVEAGKLSGTLENSATPGPVEIKEGKVEGDKVSFHVLRTLNNAETKVLWQGTVAGSEIKFTRRAENATAAGGAPTEIVAKRPQ